MLSRLTIRLGIVVAVISILGLMGLATAAGTGAPAMTEAAVPLGAGVCLIVVGLIARDPRRAQSTWLFAVALAALVMYASVPGISAVLAALGGGSGIHWWRLAQVAFFAMAAGFVAASALANYRMGQRQVLDAAARQAETARAAGSQRSKRRR